MNRLSLTKIINILLFTYILSLYLFTYKIETFIISNILACLLIFLISIDRLLVRKKIVVNKCLYFYLIFICICSITCFYALDQFLAISKVKTLVSIFIIMFFLLNYIDTFEKLNKCIIYFIYSGFIASIYIYKNSDFSNIIRFGSQLGNVNSIGMNVGVSVIFCFHTIVNQKKYYNLFIFIIMVPIVLLTGSRKALLFVFINIILIMYLKNRKKLSCMVKFIVLSIIITIIIGFLIFYIPYFYKIIGVRIENLFSFLFDGGTKENSMNMRAYMAKFGFDLFKENPFLGYGINNYRILFNENCGLSTYSHNNFIELMIGTGILGVLVYYLIHIVVLKDLLKIKQSENYLNVNYVFIAIISSYIILAPSLVYYDSKHFSILLIVASGVRNIISKDKL